MFLMIIFLYRLIWPTLFILIIKHNFFSVSLPLPLLFFFAFGILNSKFYKDISIRILLPIIRTELVFLINKPFCFFLLHFFFFHFQSFNHIIRKCCSKKYQQIFFFNDNTDHKLQKEFLS